MLFFLSQDAVFWNAKKALRIGCEQVCRGQGQAQKCILSDNRQGEDAPGNVSCKYLFRRNYLYNAPFLSTNGNLRKVKLIIIISKMFQNVQNIYGVPRSKMI